MRCIACNTKIETTTSSGVVRCSNCGQMCMAMINSSAQPELEDRTTVMPRFGASTASAESAASNAGSSSDQTMRLSKVDINSYNRSGGHEYGGATFFGEFRILERISRGGMGDVYKAEQQNPSRLVALKVMRAGNLADESQRARFMREIATIALLNHPYIVPIYESGEDNGMLFYAMEFVEGRSLEQDVKDGRMSLTARLQLFRKICDGIQAAHMRGVIHRDLKPSNILIDRNNNPRIVDFGIAKIIGGADENTAVTQENSMPGTPAFMAPEQILGSKCEIDTRTDVYALGIILFNLLTGSYPYDISGSALTVLRRIQNEEPKRPRQLSAHIPPDLEAIVMKAIDKVMANRYQSPGSMQRDISRFLAGEPVEAHRLTTAYRLKKLVLRNKAISAAVSLALIFIVSVLTISFTRISKARRDAESALVTVEQAHALAELQRREAELQRLRAEEALTEVESGRREAIRQQQIAEQERLVAIEQREIAEQERQRAQAERQRAAFHMRNLTLKFSADCIVQRDSEGFQLLADMAPTWETGFLREELSRQTYHNARSIAAASGSTAFAVNADGNVVATASGGSIILTSLVDGTRLSSIDYGSNLTVEAMKFSPNGQRLAAAWAGSIRIFKLDKDQHILLPLHGQADIKPVLAFSPNGDFLAGSSDGAVKIWSAQTGAAIMTVNSNIRRIAAIGFHPRMHTLAITDGNLIRLWALPGGQSKGEFIGHDAPVTALDYSADGNHLATASIDGTVLVWSSGENSQLRRFSVGFGCRSVAISPDASMVAAGADNGVVTVWPLLKTETPAVLKGHRGRVAKVIFGKDATTLISTAWNGNTNVWKRTPGGGRERISVSNSAISAVASSHDANTVAVVDGNSQVRVWLREAGHNRAVLTGTGDCADAIALTDDGRLLAAATENRILLYAVAWDEIVANFDQHSRHVKALTFSADNKYLAASSERSILIWETEPPYRMRVLSEDSGAQTLAFSADGQMLASGATDGKLTLWDLASGKALRVVTHAAGGQAVRFSPDGRLLAADSADGSIRIWTLGSNDDVTILKGHSQWVYDMSFTPNSRLLASVDVGGNLVLWDLQHAAPLPLEAAIQISDARCLAFSGNGRSLVIGCNDGRVEMLHSAFPASRDLEKPSAPADCSATAATSVISSPPSGEQQ